MTDSREGPFKRAAAVSPPADDGSAHPSPVASRPVRVCIGETVTVRSGDILDHPVDLDAHLSGIPPSIHVKGYFANQLAAYVGETRPVAYPQYMQLHPALHSAVQRVPSRDVLRCVYDAARLSHPDLPVAEAVRRVGWSAYESLLGSLLGKMLYAALGKDLESIYRFGPRAYSYAGNTVHLVYTRLGDKHFRYDYDPCFGWLDCYQVGIVEGAATACGRSTELLVHLTGPYHGWLECRWF